MLLAGTFSRCALDRVEYAIPRASWSRGSTIFTHSGPRALRRSWTASSVPLTPPPMIATLGALVVIFLLCFDHSLQTLTGLSIDKLDYLATAFNHVRRRLLVSPTKICD